MEGFVIKYPNGAMNHMQAVNHNPTKSAINSGINLVNLSKALFLKKNTSDALSGEIKPFEQTYRHMSVNPKHLKQYLSVCGFDSIGYLPSCYPHLMLFNQHINILTQPDFPFPLIGLIHLSIEYRQYRKLSSKEKFNFKSYAANLSEVENGHRFELISKVYVGSELVWRCRSLFQVAKPKKANANPVSSNKPKLNNPQAVLGADEEGLNWLVSPSDARRYARVSKDFNPIHLSKLTARMGGFSGVIAHGMYLLGKALAETSYFHSDAMEVNARFLKPLYLPAKPIFVMAYDGSNMSGQLVSEDKNTRHLTLSVNEVPKRAPLN